MIRLLSFAFLAVAQPAVGSFPWGQGIIPEHGHPPAWRTVETVYECGGRRGHIVVRYSHQRFELVSMIRRGVRLPARDLLRANAALRRFDGLSELVPECGSTWDTIMAAGLIGRRRAIVFIVWSDREFRASAPEFIS